ncbi:hypothetical protein CGT69_05360, partial [Vibrio cholerae]|uniref:hypothetical protein n=1 Tax=Vibrio cholerae TaxID=666 RepID=UPI000BDA825B
SLSRGAPSASRPPHRLAEAHITIYQKYVKHFLGENSAKQLNRWQIDQSAENLHFLNKNTGINKKVGVNGRPFFDN